MGTHADIYVKTSFSLSACSLSHFLELFDTYKPKMTSAVGASKAPPADVC